MAYELEKLFGVPALYRPKLKLRAKRPKPAAKQARALPVPFRCSAWSFELQAGQ
jgi:hypothetical protein